MPESPTADKGPYRPNGGRLNWPVIGADDVRYVDEAVERAKSHRPELDGTLFGFFRSRSISASDPPA